MWAMSSKVHALQHCTEENRPLTPLFSYQIPAFEHHSFCIAAFIYCAVGSLSFAGLESICSLFFWLQIYWWGETWLSDNMPSQSQSICHRLQYVKFQYLFFVACACIFMHVHKGEYTSITYPVHRNAPSRDFGEELKRRRTAILAANAKKALISPLLPQRKIGIVIYQEW